VSYVDEIMCHVQKTSSQVSSVRDRVLPMWLAMVKRQLPRRNHLHRRSQRSITEEVMPTPERIHWYQANHQTADLGCPHCCGVTSHESWCSTQNLNVRYAFQVVSYPDCLTHHDSLILHALGASWEDIKR
jgi:hypothetical protein